MAYAKFEALPTQFVDVNGAPLSGGSLTFYLAGTSTEAAVYSDSAGTALATGAVTLNSRGTFQTAGGTPVEVYGDTDVAYDATLKDSVGATIDTYDDLYPGNLSLKKDLADSASASNGDALVAFKRTLAGAVASTLHNWHEWQVVNVFEFMSSAEITDVTSGAASVDVSSAIQAAIDAAAPLQLVVFPDGTGYKYRIDSTVNAKGRALVGLGRPDIDITNLTASEDAFYVAYDTTYFGWRIHNFHFVGSGGRHCINVNGTQFWEVYNIKGDDPGGDVIHVEGTAGSATNTENFRIIKVEGDTPGGAGVRLKIVDGATTNYINEGSIEGLEVREAGEAEVILEVDNNTAGSASKISGIAFFKPNFDIRLGARATPYNVHFKRSNSSTVTIEHVDFYSPTFENTSGVIASSYGIYVDSGLNVNRVTVIRPNTSGLTGTAGGDPITGLVQITAGGNIVTSDGDLLVGDTSSSYKAVIKRDGTAASTGFITQWLTEAGGSLSLQTVDNSQANPEWRISMGSGETLEVYQNSQIAFKINASGQVLMPNLPTSTPGGSGIIWNNSGVLNIT